MQKYMQQHGTSYYVGNRFSPEEVREDVFALYAFVRIPDDVVDDPSADTESARAELDEMWNIFENLYNKNLELNVWETHTERLQVSTSAAEVFHRYDIPIEWVRDFFWAMYADLDRKVYRTYADLQSYMYGSAEVIGLMMCKIIWYDESQEAEVFRTAKLLWEAMQYTNCLRDVSEDLFQYDRLYVPEDRLMMHDLNHTLLSQYVRGKPVDKQWKKFLRQQILECKELYREANRWILLLDPRWRKAVRVASWMYESILDKIIRNDYDVFVHSARTTKREKICTLLTKSLHYAMGKID